jgi:hypothetical protein
VRLPVASTGLNPTPVPDTDVTVKANSIAIPAGFNPRDPASVAAALAALPNNGSDRYAVSQPDDLLLIIPVLESESAEVMTGGFISAIEYEYALTLPAETFELATGGFIEEVDPEPADLPYEITQGTESPLLGDGQADSSAALADDWSLLYDDTTTEGLVTVQDVPFDIVIGVDSEEPAGIYNSLAVAGQQALLFGDEEHALIFGLDLEAPVFPSMQRVYAKIDEDKCIIRWEGNTDPAAEAEDSNRFVEISFYRLKPTGVAVGEDDSYAGIPQRYIEIRSGNFDTASGGIYLSGLAGPAAGSDDFAANESWVIVGNEDGNEWAIFQGFHVAES